MRTSFVIYLCLLPVLAWAKAGNPAIAASPAAEVDAVLSKYRKAKSLQAKVTKTVVQELVGSETKSDGDFYFSKGKLRLEFGEPENSKLVYDGKTVWLESRLDDKTVQVMKLRSNELKKSDSLLAALFERKDILKNFKLLETKESEGVKTYKFEPNDKKKTEVQFLELALKNKELQRISYKDQVENQVSFDFQNLSKGSVAPSKFTYKVPKGANVTVM